MMSSPLHTAVLKVLKQRNEQAQIQAQNNLNRALNNPEFQAAYQQQRNLIFEMGKKAFLNQDITPLQARYKQVQEQIAHLLEVMGMTPQMLSVQYTCEKCKDSGFVDGIPCGCYHEIASDILLQNCGLSQTQLPTFEQTQFDVFEPSVQPTMKQWYAKMKAYSDHLEKTTKKTVSIIGNTGVGKTHLAQCMVQNAIAHQVYCVYTTAIALNAEMLRYHLAPLGEKPAILQPYLTCDLLVIDDLGCEPIYQNVTEEYLYYILSERMIKNKNTVLTTNLSLQQIREVYGERIFSRLVHKDKTLLMELKGKDLRVDI